MSPRSFARLMRGVSASSRTMAASGPQNATVSMSPRARGRERRATCACAALSAAGWTVIALLLFAALSERLCRPFGSGPWRGALAARPTWARE